MDTCLRAEQRKAALRRVEEELDEAEEIVSVNASHPLCAQPTN